MSYLFVPGLTASDSAWDSSFKTIASCATWRGKHSLPRTWRLRWKREPWLRRLSGLTSEPSTVARGVAEFISSLPESPASPSLSRGSARASRTSAGSGPTCGEYLGRFDPVTSSWRRSGDLSGRDSVAFSKGLPVSGGLRSGICFRRPRWERRTRGKGSSSWQTATEKDSTGRAYTYPGGNHEKPFLTLAGQARNWPTPNIPNGGRQMSLEGVVRKGMTDKGKRQVDLGSVARHWPTPSAQSYGINQGGAAGRTGPKRESLEYASRSLPARQTSKPGAKPTRRLNPRFVEWLMGWPIGWTDCDSAATGSYRSWRQLHSSYFEAVLRPICEAP